MVAKQMHGKDRIIPISKKILKFVKDRYNTETKYLIEIDGKPVTYKQYINEIWTPVMEELGMNHTPHECRHTCNSLLANAGVDELTRKYILGHKTDSGINERYTHLHISKLVEAIDLI